MSYRIQNNTSFSKPQEATSNLGINFSKDAKWNVSGVDEEQSDTTTDTILNISKEARRRLTNRPKGPVKKSGVTSAREQFEVEALERRMCAQGQRCPGTMGYPNMPVLDEWMRIDEPETYAKMMSAREDAEAQDEAALLHIDWFNRRCMGPDGWWRNPVTGQRAVMSTLEERYSDAVHDVTFDIYDESFSENDNSLWRFWTKFNVSLPIEVVRELEAIENFKELSKEEQDALQEKYEKIDKAVNEMKQVEKDYEGDYVALIFGVRFDADYNVTYHAHYSGCDNDRGIKADSAEELLKLLTTK